MFSFCAIQKMQAMGFYLFGGTLGYREKKKMIEMQTYRVFAKLVTYFNYG